MFSTDNLFFLILYIVPGAIFILFNKFLKPIPNVEKDETIRLSGMLLFSFVVFGINSVLFSNDYSTFAVQETIFVDIKLLVKIIATNVFTSFISCIIWTLFRTVIFLRISNRLNSFIGKATTTGSKSVWVDIFEKNVIGNILDNHVVKVEKDGLSSVGVLQMHSSPDFEKQELLLSYVTDVQQFFNYDSEQPDESTKFFSEVLYEYVNLTDGYKIIFYNSDKYIDFIRSHYKEKDAKQSGV